MHRPGSSSGRPGSASRPMTGSKQGAGTRPPGTATRLTTGMAPGTGRPGSRGGTVPGGGVALAAQVQVAERPMTQQGLGGMKTAGRGPQRQVQDRTFFVGLLRSKTADLTSEVNRLRREVETSAEDQAGYVSYEKRAESLAVEIKESQGELADYNTLVDKMNTDESVSDIQMDYEELRAMNDREAKVLDGLFDQKQSRENAIQQFDVELQQERSMAENMVADMRSDMRKRYLELKDTNEHLLKQLERDQQELDRLNMKKGELEEELAASPVKQEAVRLYEQLHELEEKRDQLIAETQARGTPQEERDRLLRQVKEDNQEIASMDRQTNELREKITAMQDDVRQLDIDIEENQGERNQRYKELKKREETMDDFLNNFEENKMQEIERLQQLESNIVLIMEHMSRNLSRFHHLPSPQELTTMKDDLAFKENEMKKSEQTASGLAGESEKLGQDLAKVEQLETKITSELNMHRAKIDKMTEELILYSDLEQLKNDAEDKKRRLGEDKVILYKRRETFKQVMQQLTGEYEAVKTQLNENETYTQLGNLERKWQHHELNNFVMKEYIASKTQETDFRPTAATVMNMVGDYNKQLQDQLSGKGGMM